jgi:hypothetical protein
VDVERGSTVRDFRKHNRKGPTKQDLLIKYLIEHQIISDPISRANIKNRYKTIASGIKELRKIRWYIDTYSRPQDNDVTYTIGKSPKEMEALGFACDHIMTKNDGVVYCVKEGISFLQQQKMFEDREGLRFAPKMGVNVA